MLLSVVLLAEEINRIGIMLEEEIEILSVANAKLLQHVGHSCQFCEGSPERVG